MRSSRVFECGSIFSRISFIIFSSISNVVKTSNNKETIWRVRNMEKFRLNNLYFAR